MITLSPFLRASRVRAGAAHADNSRVEAHAALPAETLARVISVLMQGIALHVSPDVSKTGSDRFSGLEKAIRELRDGLGYIQFGSVQDEAAAVLVAAAAVRLLEEHSHAEEQHWNARQQEMANGLSVLSDTLLTLAAADHGTVRRVKQLEADFSCATGISAMVAARGRLAACMDELRAVSLAAPLATQSVGVPAGPKDSLTGLPDARSAVRAISGVWTRREDYYVALLTLERHENINLRFGSRAAEQLLVVLGQRLRQQITADDLLFRWNGPCLVLLLHRRMTEATVASELSRLAATRTGTAVTFRDREVMVPVSVTWKLLPLRGAGSQEELVRRMNEFPGSRVLAAAM